MASTMSSTQAVDTASCNEQQPAPRNLVTCSGETRSQLYRRLKLELAWPAAESLKEAERRRCRAAGMTKAAAGKAAWDSVAHKFPPADATTWFRLMELSDHPPSSTVDSKDLPILWAVTLKISAVLAIRCHEIGEAAKPLVAAISQRRSLEPGVVPFGSADEAQRRLQSSVDSPTLTVQEASEEFSRYVGSDSAYAAAVRVELTKFKSLLDLIPNAADRQWARTIAWLCGPDATRVKKYLLRVHACEAASGGLVEPS